MPSLYLGFFTECPIAAITCTFDVITLLAVDGFFHFADNWRLSVLVADYVFMASHFYRRKTAPPI